MSGNSKGGRLRLYGLSGYDKMEPPPDREFDAEFMAQALNLGTKTDAGSIEEIAGSLISQGAKMIAIGNELHALAKKKRELEK